MPQKHICLWRNLSCSLLHLVFGSRISITSDSCWCFVVFFINRQSWMQRLHSWFFFFILEQSRIVQLSVCVDRQGSRSIQLQYNKSVNSCHGTLRRPGRNLSCSLLHLVFGSRISIASDSCGCFRGRFSSTAKAGCNNYFVGFSYWNIPG